MTGSGEYGNGPSGSINDTEFLKQLSDFSTHKNNSVELVLILIYVSLE
jgi:hypothetical protein